MTSTPTKQQAWFGWCMYDWANSGFTTVILAAVLPVYFTSLVPDGGATLRLMGTNSRPLPASALWGYTIAISMLAVALSAPYLGRLADRGSLHRRFLAIFCTAGAVATGMLWLAGPGRYLLAAGLLIVANFCYASSNVFYNAFLPKLAADGELDRLSARGFAFGYVGGGLILLVVFIMIQQYRFFGFSDPGSASRAGFLLTGLWWFVFFLPTFLYVRPEKTARVAAKHGGIPIDKRMPGYLQTFTELRQYRNLLLFLIAFLFYNDGIQTIIVVAAIFGREELGLSQSAVLGCFLMVQFVAMPGTLVFGRMATMIGAKRTVLISLLLFVLVTLFAYFMTTTWHFWLLGFVIAIVLGGSQAVSRSLFSSLIPAGKHAEFFGFYAISAKFASVFGPLVFALIADITSSTRLAILALTFFFLTGMLLLSKVDIETGKREAAG